MFTGLSALSALLDAAIGNRPFCLCRRPPRSDTSGSVSSRAAAQRANSVGWCNELGRGVLGSQLAPKIRSNKGLRPPPALERSANSSIQVIRGCAALSRRLPQIRG